MKRHRGFWRASFGLGRAIGAGLAAALVAAGAAQAAAVKSVYSSVEPKDCLLFHKEPLGEGRVCEGVAGFNLVLSRFDGRAALELVRDDWGRNRIAPLTAAAPDFSWIAGSKAEWRLQGDAPRALILRIGVSATAQRPERAETRLLVMRLDAGDARRSCLVGVVSGGRGGNKAARAMADQAAALPCLR